MGRIPKRDRGEGGEEREKRGMKGAQGRDSDWRPRAKGHRDPKIGGDRDPGKVGNRQMLGGKQRCRKRGGWRPQRQAPREKGKEGGNSERGEEFQKEDRDPEYGCMGVGGRRRTHTQRQVDRDPQRKGRDTGSPIKWDGGRGGRQNPERDSQRE